ncbi:MAG: RNA degradosome polyphosphate kinase, partial [Alphaproteobacteria bacterium]
LHTLQQSEWRDLKQELSDQHLDIKTYDLLSSREQVWVDAYFENQLFPILTPIAVDPAHPFPFVKNLAVGLAIQLTQRKGKAKERDLNGLLLMPENTPQFIEIDLEDSDKQDARVFIHLHDLIMAKLNDFFPRFTIEASGFFQIIRDSDIDLEEEAEDLVRLFKTALKRRQRGNVVRLTVDQHMPESVLNFITNEFDVREEDVYRAEALLSPAHLSELADLDLPSLRFMPFHPRFPERIRDFDGDCFAAIAVKDIIVHHPFESFDVVVRFLKQAAKDPNVVMIKQTLYRTSRGSPIVRALIEAAEAGKSVTALIELKARFDEEANIRWARDLERAGVQVVYGFVELKTHAKISLIARREGKHLKAYVHYGTGNYHPITAQVYTDLSYFTCDPELTADAGLLFNYMTSYARPTQMSRLAAAPFNMRKTLKRLIRREVQNVTEGKQGGIWAKMNSLVDPEIIDELYKASEAGVKIELIIRGICCLRPGIEGLSSNIKVKSIVGRFLEHSRICCFGNGAALPSPAAAVFISSADWMPRNLDRRVETLIPISNPTVHRQILERIMDANRKDHVNSWEMQADGSYSKCEADEGAFDAHAYFMTNPSLSGRGSASVSLNKVTNTKPEVKQLTAIDAVKAKADAQ